MKKMYELKEMLCEELDKLADKGQVTSGSLELIEKLTASIHYIDEIIQMEEGGYSNARGRGRGANRDAMGRYSNNDNYSNRMSYDGYSRDGYSRDGYSRDGYSNYSNEYSRDGGYSRDAKHMVHQLRSMLQDAPDPETKKAIEKCINQIEG
jgi:hypothetical protein